MSTTLTSPSASFGMRFNLQSGTAPAISGATISQSITPTLAAGSSSGQVQLGTIINISVVNGTPYTLNLISGTDVLGNALGLATFVGFQLTITSSGGGVLVVGGGTHPVMGTDQITTQTGGTIQTVQPGTGWAVVSSTSDTLQITSSSGTITAVLTLFGR
nr:hypothetical protein [uncultured Rhodopila sp.]